MESYWIMIDHLLTVYVQLVRTEQIAVSGPHPYLALHACNVNQARRQMSM